MSKVKWTRQTPTFWAAGIDGHGISVKREIQSRTGEKFYTAFFIADGIHWHSEGMNHLKYAKAAAEQMAQRWAKGEA